MTKGSFQMSVDCKVLEEGEIQVLLTWDLYQDFKVVPAPGLSRICVCVRVCGQNEDWK